MFLFIATKGCGWKVPENVINVFLGATVVELVGLAFVVTKYLFDRGS